MKQRKRRLIPSALAIQTKNGLWPHLTFLLTQTTTAWIGENGILFYFVF